MLNKQVATSPLYDRNFVLAMASQSCFVIANTLMTHYARWIDFLGGSVSEVGWIMGVGAVAGVLLRPWLGQWINRLGARTTWLGGYGIFAVGSLGNLLLHDLNPAIYVMRMCLVLGAAVVFSSSLTYVTQTAPSDRRTEAIGILGVGGFLGMMLGPVLGDLILSEERTRGDFVMLFLAAGLANLIPAILICFIRAPAGQGHNSVVSLRGFLRTTWDYWPGLILLVDVAFGVCMTVPLVFLANYVDQELLRIPGVSIIGLFFWCYAGWGLTVRVTLRRVPEQIGRRKVLLAGLVFLSLGMVCFCLVDAKSPWSIVVPALMTGTGHGLVFHTMTSLTVESFPTEVRGTGAALALMMMDLGTSAGAPLLGLIADRFGFDWMFSTIGWFALAVAVAYAMSSIPVWQQRRDPRDVEAAAATQTAIEEPVV